MIMCDSCPVIDNTFLTRANPHMCKPSMGLYPKSKLSRAKCYFKTKSDAFELAKNRGTLL